MNYKAGQLANRLFYFSHFIANSLEYKYRLINPSFKDYKELFTATSLNDFGGHDISMSLTPSEQLDELLRKTINGIQKIPVNPVQNIPGFYFHNIKAYDAAPKSFDMNDHAFVKAAKSKVVFINGWLYRDHQNFEKYSSTLRSIFTPLPKYADRVKEAVYRCRQQGDTIVGVHIRRGDYKTYNGGKWYYPDEVYISKMQELRSQLESQGKNCIFLLCSNEKIDKEKYSGLTIMNEDRPFIVDLYALSQCDYLIGPPSTFTMWASFYGQTPLFHLEEASQEIVLSEFKAVTRG